LESVLPYLAGETDTPPLPLDIWLQPERCALAARYSREHGGETVRLQELPKLMPAAAHGYDGTTFARGYRAAKYPQGA
jgi:hypothetical protein